MKIALPITSLISSGKYSAPTAIASGPDFHDTFTAAAASCSARSNKSVHPEETKKKATQSPEQDVPAETPVAATQVKVAVPIVTQQPENAPSQPSTLTGVNQGETWFQTNSDSTDSTSVLPGSSSLTETMQMQNLVSGTEGTEPPAAAPNAALLLQAGIESTPVNVEADKTLGGTGSSSNKAASAPDAASSTASSVQNMPLSNAAKLPSIAKATDPTSNEVVPKGKKEVKAVESSPNHSIAAMQSSESMAKDLTSADKDSAKPASDRASGGDSYKTPGERLANEDTGADEGATAAKLATMLRPDQNSATTVPVASPNIDLQTVLPMDVAKASNGTSNFSSKEGGTSKTASSGKLSPAISNEGFKSSLDVESYGTAPIGPASVPLSGKSAEPVSVANTVATVTQDPSGATAIAQQVESGQAAAPIHAQPDAQSRTAADGAAIQPQATAAVASAPVDITPSLSSAQLIQSMHHSEMRLGMQSEEFGNISINTSLNHQALSAQISIDHSELSRALAVHLSSIEEKLGNAYGVQARVEVRDAVNSNTSSYSNSGQQSKEERQSRGGTSTGSAAGVERMNALTSSVTNSVAASTTRLDIRI